MNDKKLRLVSLLQSRSNLQEITTEFVNTLEITKENREKLLALIGKYNSLMYEIIQLEIELYGFKSK